jgi:transcriptional regulator with XRE-family HTH domain
MTKDFNTLLIESISNEIIFGLKNCNLTQKEIGDTLGITQAGVSHILTGKSQINLENFIRISSILNLDPKEILANAEKKILEEKVLTKSEEKVIYKSKFHFFIYFSAAKPIPKEFLKNPIFPKLEIEKALDDLINSSLLKENKTHYYIDEANYLFSTSSKQSALLEYKRFFEIVDFFQDIWISNFENFDYRNERFNSMYLEYLTEQQFSEIKTILFMAYQKIVEYSKFNKTINNLNGDNEKYKLFIFSLFASKIDWTNK